MVIQTSGRGLPPKSPTPVRIDVDSMPTYRAYRDDKYNKYAPKPGASRGPSLATLPFLVIGFSVGWLMSTILVPDLMTLPSGISVAQVGYVHDALSRQGISYAVFHSRQFKQRFASLVRKTGKVAVAGLEHEGEVRFLAETGYEIYAFEPLQQHYEAIRKLNAKRPHWMVHLHKVVLGNTSGGMVKLVYDNRKGSEEVQRAQIDDYISEEIDVLSVDIQGNELEVLQGAKNLLENHHIRSLWVEITGCNPKAAEVLRLLERRYIIFDLVPWGARKGKAATRRSNVVPLGNGILTDRPHKHPQYLQWLCENAKQTYKWVQTDIVAVRRDLVTTELLERLSTVANDALVGSLSAAN